MHKLPLPTISRIGYLYSILSRLDESNKVSSTELGKHCGHTASIVRKDIHLLGIGGIAGAKYNVGELKRVIEHRLGYDRKRRVCVVGLGRLGTALLEHFSAEPQTVFTVVAGFDSNVNRLETIRTGVPLFPACDIESRVQRDKIEIALIAVPPLQAQEVADRCCNGGISGIVNFSPTTVVNRNRERMVFVRSIDIGSELNVIAAWMHLCEI